MEQAKMARINELARKAKAEGLTPEELEEQAALRAEYIAGFRASLTAQLENTVMVGDTKFDVLGAAQHGIPTIGVSWGYGEVADMEKAGAIAIAHTMDELVKLLNQ